MRLFVLAVLLLYPLACLADEPAVATRPKSNIAIFYGEERLLISCPSGTPLELVCKIKDWVSISKETPVYIDVTPFGRFRSPEVKERVILLELSETQCRICVPRDIDLQQMSELASVLKADGYSSDFRLVHFDVLVEYEDPDDRGEPWLKWITPNAQPQR